MPIGDEIKGARKKVKLTQAELAEKSGLSLMSIRRYEAGERQPTLVQIQDISDALKVPISEFLTGEQLEGHKLNAANRGLQTILESLYDTVAVDWHKTVDNDGVPEYDGDFNVLISKKGEQDITLTKKEWETLFCLVCQNIPAYIKLIEDYEPPYDVTT